jgi:hypothetical protein
LLTRHLELQRIPQVFRANAVGRFVDILPDMVPANAKFYVFAETRVASSRERCGFSRSLRPNRCKKRVPTLELNNAAADCNGRLSEIVPLGLDAFFPRIALRAPGLRKVVAKLKQLAGHMRPRCAETAEEGNYQKLNGAESHAFVPETTLTLGRRSRRNGVLLPLSTPNRCQSYHVRPTRADITTVIA